MNGHISFASHASPDRHEARARAVAHGFVLATVFTLLALSSTGLAGCAKAQVDNAGGAYGGATGGATGQGTSGSGGTIQFTIDLTQLGTPSSVDAEVTSQVVGCDGGDSCVCPTLKVAVVGNPGVWGDRSDTAFQDWLNSSSAGTAKVDNYPAKPTFAADFLAGYNLIILAGLGDNSNNGPWWTFSASEVAAFQDWIENQGGGVISLSGYSNDNNEISAKNALLAFSGISYDQECISPPCAIVDASNNRMCYRCGNPYQITQWNQSDSVIANLSFDVTMIGIDGGRPISAPADAHVAAMTTNASSVSNWLVGKITGKGRVLVYADEWITYTDQWDGQDKQYSNDSSCSRFLPQELYQTAQFWYNMIHWSQPAANCFTIVNTPTTNVVIW
jgi:hypothetical protein